MVERRQVAGIPAIGLLAFKQNRHTHHSDEQAQPATAQTARENMLWV